MFKWKYSEIISTEATAEQIWEMWQDVSSWPCWDSELKWVRLNGSFTEGTTGKMKPASGPEVAFTLSRVELNRAFSDIAKLPLTKVVFDHEYLGASEKEPSARICHSVSMTGLLAPLFGRIIGRQIKSHLRDAMLELSRRAITGDKTIS